ncbi:MAG: hypothetical protein ACPIOQ_70940, partial [Promethearchaeia archaeon]
GSETEPSHRKKTRDRSPPIEKLLASWSGSIRLAFDLTGAVVTLPGTSTVVVGNTSNPPPCSPFCYLWMLGVTGCICRCQ